MSTQVVSQTAIDDFSGRVSRLHNRTQRLRDNMVEFGARWGISLDGNKGQTVNPTQHEQSTVQTHTEHVAVNAPVEPVRQNTAPVQPIKEEPVVMNVNHDDIDLDSLLAEIKLDDNELSL